MKKIYLLALLSFSYAKAQDTAVVNWINSNAITIEDTSLDIPLTNLKQNTPNVFKDVKLFGFGEATHYTKEFFALKAKFFKYLVENEGVTVFMMEDGYAADYAVNSQIAKGGANANQMAANLGFAVWRNQEVSNLLRWMQQYNVGKPEEKQVKIYGIDNQFGYETDKIVTAFITKYSIKISPDAIAIAEAVANLPHPYSNNKKLKEYAEGLVSLKKQLQDTFGPQDAAQEKELDLALHTVTVLEQYVAFRMNPGNKDRDRAMADNVIWALQHEGPDAKGFVWAHNDHVAKVNDRTPLGYFLKTQFGAAYYSMGFDFGTGQLYGKIKDGEKYKGVLHTINVPFKDTYAAVFSQAKAGIFFIDIKMALQDVAMKQFFNSNKKVITTGSLGYNPKFEGAKENFTEEFDGIIFVRAISYASYFESAVPEIMRISKY